MGFVLLCDDQEPLPIPTHVVGEDVECGNRLPAVGLKKRDRGAGFKALSAYRKDLPAWR
jgi:hypothetical protein